MRMLHLHSMFVQEVGRVADRGRHDSQAGVGEAALEGSAARSARLAAAGAEACVAGQARSASGTKAGSAARGCGDAGIGGDRGKPAGSCRVPGLIRRRGFRQALTTRVSGGPVLL